MYFSWVSPLGLSALPIVHDLFGLYCDRCKLCACDTKKSAGNYRGTTINHYYCTCFFTFFNPVQEHFYASLL